VDSPTSRTARRSVRLVGEPGAPGRGALWAEGACGGSVPTAPCLGRASPEGFIRRGPVTGPPSAAPGRLAAAVHRSPPWVRALFRAAPLVRRARPVRSLIKRSRT